MDRVAAEVKRLYPRLAGAGEGTLIERLAMANVSAVTYVREALRLVRPDITTEQTEWWMSSGELPAPMPATLSP